MWYDLKATEDSILYFYNIVNASALTIADWSKNKTMDFLNGPFVQSIAVSCILFIGRMQANGYFFLKHLYDRNELIRFPTDFVLWTYETIELMNIRHRQEPTSTRWLNVCSSSRLTRGAYIGKTPFTFAESYNKMNDLSEKEDMIQAFEVALDNNGEFAQENKEYIANDTIVVMKFNGAYKVSRATHPVKSQTYDLVKSKVRFLSVEYNVPQSTTSLSLKIPVEMSIQGNELFSHAFVRRLLEYQPDSVEFDFNYRLKIMDSDVNEIELNNTQYIVLGETSYEVKEI
jgi:hypothetical protein